MRKGHLLIAPPALGKTLTSVLFHNTGRNRPPLRSLPPCGHGGPRFRPSVLPLFRWFCSFHALLLFPDSFQSPGKEKSDHGWSHTSLPKITGNRSTVPASHRMLSVLLVQAASWYPRHAHFPANCSHLNPCGTRRAWKTRDVACLAECLLGYTKARADLNTT